MMLYYAILLFASVLLIIGTKKREHTKLMLFMIFMIIGIFIGFLQVFSNGLFGLFVGLIGAAIDIYFFICIYSLYDKFKNERIAQGVTPYAQPQQTAIIIQEQQHQPTAFNQPENQTAASQPYQQYPIPLQQSYVNNENKL